MICRPRTQSAQIDCVRSDKLRVEPTRASVRRTRAVLDLRIRALIGAPSDGRPARRRARA